MFDARKYEKVRIYHMSESSYIINYLRNFQVLINKMFIGPF